MRGTLKYNVFEYISKHSMTQSKKQREFVPVFNNKLSFIWDYFDLLFFILNLFIFIKYPTSFNSYVYECSMLYITYIGFHNIFFNREISILEPLK